MRQKVSFKSGELELAGQLEQPSGEVKFYALFATVLPALKM